MVLAPLFNRFEALPPGQARADVIELGERAGVEIGEVYEVDASRRSTALNAYVSGLGPTKRVVLYDTLLDELEPRRRFAPWSPTSSPTSSTATSRAGCCGSRSSLRSGCSSRAARAARLAARTGAEPGTPAALPAFALALSVTCSP